MTIDTQTGNWEYNVDYYTLGHVSKFVDPGAVRIDSTSLDGNIETVAFKNPDGGKVLVLANLQDAAQTVKIRWGDRSMTYTMLPESLVTMTWSGAQTGTDTEPIWFNNLENNTNYSAGTGASVSPAASTANLGGSNGIKLTTTANGDPGTASQCATITPQESASVDGSPYQYLTFSVKDMVNPGSCTVKVTFVDMNGNESSAWSHEKTVYENWTRVWVPVGGALGFDRTHIAQIRLGFYWKGDYYIDDIAFCNGYSDGIPPLSNNLVSNASFEDDGSAVAQPKG